MLVFSVDFYKQVRYQQRFKGPVHKPLFVKDQLQRFDKLSLSDRLRHVENGFNINF